MDHKDFDNILRDKLGQLNDAAPMQPDWERMEKEILEDSLKDQSFDAQIKRKLADIKVGHYNAKNWSLLYELIDKRIKNKQAVLAYKFIELSLVFLIFFTSFNLGYFDDSDSQQNINVASTQQVASVLQSVVDTNSDQEQSPTKLIDSEEIIGRSGITAETSSISKTNKRFETITSEAKSANSFGFINIPVAPLPIENRQIAFSGALKSTSENLEINLIDDVNSDIASDVRKLAFAEMRENVTSEFLPVTDLTYLTQKSNHAVFSDLKAAKQASWFVSLQSGYQFNQIESDVYESIVYGRNGLTSTTESNIKQSMNVAFALEVGKSAGDFDFSVGAGYQHVQYNPALNLTTGNITSKYTETSVESIGYQLLSIPLNLRWKAASWRSWSINVQGSLINTILFKSEQEIRQRLIQGDRIQNVAQNEIDFSPLAYEFTQGLSDEPATIADGILSNYFLRGSFGGELSKKIAPRTAIFGSYNYIFNLPLKSQKFDNSDMINSQYFGIGVRRYVG